MSVNVWDMFFALFERYKCLKFHLWLKGRLFNEQSTHGLFLFFQHLYLEKQGLEKDEQQCTLINAGRASECHINSGIKIEFFCKEWVLVLF